MPLYKLDPKEKKEFLKYLKKAKIRMKGEMVHVEDADQIADLYERFREETIPHGGLTEKVKKEILEDYKEWSGGFGPEEDHDGWDKYIKHNLPKGINPDEVREWWETL